MCGVKAAATFFFCIIEVKLVHNTKKTNKKKTFFESLSCMTYKCFYSCMLFLCTNNTWFDDEFRVCSLFIGNCASWAPGMESGFAAFFSGQCFVYIFKLLLLTVLLALRLCWNLGFKLIYTFSWLQTWFVASQWRAVSLQSRSFRLLPWQPNVISLKDSCDKGCVCTSRTWFGF